MFASALLARFSFVSADNVGLLYSWHASLGVPIRACAEGAWLLVATLVSLFYVASGH